VWILFRPLARITAAALWVLVAAYLYAVHTPVVLRAPRYNDFGRFYYSLQAWAAGGSLYQPTIATLLEYRDGYAAHLWNMNPPHAHLLFWPFVLLPITSAFALWTAANMVAAGCAIFAAVRATGIRPAGWIVALALVSEPALSWAVTGQLAGFLMAAVTALWLSIRREDWTGAGILVGLTCSVKPFLLVFVLWWLVQRRWRALAWAGVSGGLAVLVGVLIYGVSSYAEWIGVLRDVRWMGAPMNASIAGMIGRTWSRHALVWDAWTLQIAKSLALVVIPLGVWFAVRARDPDRAVLILLLTALLASPLGWVYYLWMIAGPALVVWRRPAANALVMAGLIGVLVPHFLTWPFSSTLWAGTIGSLYGWSVLLLFIGTVVHTEVPTGIQSDEGSRRPR
jgi:alpha-1,2-mannosyltransferase